MACAPIAGCTMSEARPTFALAARLYLCWGFPAGPSCRGEGFGVAAGRQRPSTVAAAPPARSHHRADVVAVEATHLRDAPGRTRLGVLGDESRKAGMGDQSRASPCTSGGSRQLRCRRRRRFGRLRQASSEAALLEVESRGASAGRALRTDAGGGAVAFVGRWPRGELWVAEAENRDGKAKEGKRNLARQPAPGGQSG